ncbi:MAG: GTPase ObgE [Thermodesulfobacteriota bacterium]
MKFIDEAIITVSSGNGGDGCVSFRREKYVPRGGPDGGDGGKGGDIILIATSKRNSLFHFRSKKQFQAQNGQNGQSTQKAGKNGKDLVIQIPPGTLIRDAQSETIIKDFTLPGESWVIARGGKGGLGNTRFKSSTNQSPKFAQPGKPGQTLTIKLELKLIADAGIIGLPNAGKSSLIRAISSAKPKVGDYPFTTLIPNLGMVYPKKGAPFIVADIPGLIQGAHQGIGLGIRFLKHIERTHILIHLIDASIIDISFPLDGYETVNRELALYNPSLTEKKQLVVLNKMDLPDTKNRAEAFEKRLHTVEILKISAKTGEGIDALIHRLSLLCNQHDGTCSK